MLCVADTASVQFGQAVNEIVFRAFDAVVHTEIDDLHVFGYGMALHELFRIAVSGTEEKEVDLVQPGSSSVNTNLFHHTVRYARP